MKRNEKGKKPWYAIVKSMVHVNLEYLFSSSFSISEEYTKMEKIQRSLEVMFKDMVWLLYDEKIENL